MKNDPAKVAVVFRAGPGRGSLAVAHGALAALKVAAGRGGARGGAFDLPPDRPARLEVAVAGARLQPGAFATRVSIVTRATPFSFFLRDVNAQTPILIPEYGVAVIPAADPRDYEAVAGAVRSAGLQSELQRYAAEPEETYADACRRNRDQMCPTWLGLSRDMRIFRVGHSPAYGYWGYLQPCYHSVPQAVPESDNKPYRVDFAVGRGAACRVQITRRLEDGVLPILRSEQRDKDIVYQLTAFATLETQPLSLKNIRGTDWRAAYPNTGGHMLSPEELGRLKPLLEKEMHGRAEEVVCCARIEAVNAGRAPAYAWFMAPGPEFDGQTGFSRLKKATRVYAVNRLNGEPMPDREMAILLQPGATAAWDLLVPHQPLSAERAARLARLDSAAHLAACRKFWRAKLAAAARIRVPDPAVDDRLRAGLLHCDLVALGREPDGPVLATIGWYSPIGSESAPIIQFFDSLGWHKLAERALDFFLARQRPDGFIQNFGGYQLETGPALWTMGEHYRYTRDAAWVRRIKPKLLKACEYLLAWRERNKKEELRGRGYGMLDGKVADPEDYFHSFMLNGLSYVGILRVAEMLARVDPAASRRLAREAKSFRSDIRREFSAAMARSPVIPVGDGTWVPTFPSWAEYPGPLALYAEGGNWFTHGAFGGRDSLIGASYLVIAEVLDPDEIAATFLLKSHQALFTLENAGLSQPYYSRHDYLHLRRREVKAFLKTYYNQFTALQDRETYTFWEHYFGASEHKTHEEGWFLMQTRWMLWMEEGETLTLLRAIPRRWLEAGRTIELRKVASYFGPVSLRVASHLDDGCIEATVECRGARQPQSVSLRLPHPEGRKPRAVEGGRYCPKMEAVRIENFKNKARVRLIF